MSDNTKIHRRHHNKPRLLVVDDESEIRLIMKEVLAAHFDVIEASNGKEAVHAAEHSLPDLILMDVMMPEMDGITATESIRALPVTRHIPICLLTAANTKDYRIRAFGLGADQYIGKPVDLDEITSRLLSVYKRSKELSHPVGKELQYLNLTIHYEAKEVRIDHQRIDVSPVEYDILKLLVLNHDTLVTRSQIIEEVWKTKSAPERVMDAHIVSIRKKLAGFKGVLKTVYGSGYILRPVA